MNDYPLTQKTVQLSTYSRQQPAQFTTVESRSGKMYFKKIAQNQPTTRSISFTFSAELDAHIFLSWFTDVLKNGFLPFDIKLATEWETSQTIRCRFLPDSLLNASRPNSLQWNYTATLLIENYGPPDYIPKSISLYQNYYNREAMLFLDEIVSTQFNNSIYLKYHNKEAMLFLDEIVSTQFNNSLYQNYYSNEGKLFLDEIVNAQLNKME